MSGREETRARESLMDSWSPENRGGEREKKKEQRRRKWRRRRGGGVANKLFLEISVQQQVVEEQS